MYVCMYVCMYVYVYVCMQACTDGWMKWMYVCTYVRLYVCAPLALESGCIPAEASILPNLVIRRQLDHFAGTACLGLAASLQMLGLALSSCSLNPPQP